MTERLEPAGPCHPCPKTRLGGRHNDLPDEYCSASTCVRAGVLARSISRVHSHLASSSRPLKPRVVLKRRVASRRRRRRSSRPIPDAPLSLPPPASRAVGRAGGRARSARTRAARFRSARTTGRGATARSGSSRIRPRAAYSSPTSTSPRATGPSSGARGSDGATRRTKRAATTRWRSARTAA